MPPTADKAITFTVSPSGGGGTSFGARRTAPGVIRSFGFDSASELDGVYGDNFGIVPGTQASPVLDSAIAAEPGLSSLRFDVPTMSDSDPCGTWFTNFSSDLLTQFGGATPVEFYIQWRQRFNSAFVTTQFQDLAGGPQGGIKHAIIGTGDKPGVPYASCTSLTIVTQTYYQSRFPILYNSCEGCASHGPYEGMYEPFSGDYKLQNEMPAPFCLYSNPDAGNCFYWVANEWLTYQVGVNVGARVGNEYQNSRTRLWGSRQGQPSQLLVDWSVGTPGYFHLCAGSTAENQRFGKIWLAPYLTNCKPTAHSLCQTWYDELIIGTQRIPDP